MTTNRIRFLLTIATPLALWTATLSADGPTHFVGAHTSSQCLFVYGTNITIKGLPAQPGDEVAVFAQSGVLCGATVVKQAGIYPAVSVYADDPMTPAVDGARPNEALTFRVWDASENTEYAQDDILVTFAEKKNGDGDPYWTGNLDAYRVDLAAVDGDTDEMIALVIRPGWNLLSLPFDTAPGRGPADVLKSDDGTTLFSGSVWSWNSREQHYEEVTDHFAATQGVWVYCPLQEKTTTKPMTGAIGTNAVALNAGWNLFGPVRTARRSEIAGMATVLEICRWNAQDRCFRNLDAETELKRGEGYWGYSEQQTGP